jgi:catechol 2,3-dioxygenase-like lactoylglutathione lyase family enzyme
MLGDKDAIANIAVKDLKVASRFYEGKLGLRKLSSEGEELITYRSGNTNVNVYRSQYAGTNKATALSFVVGEELEAFVAELKAKGITFERYDMPELKREGDVYIGGAMRVAWFKDPDGNILNLVTG